MPLLTLPALELTSKDRTFGYAIDMALKAARQMPQSVAILGGGLGRMTWAVQGALLMHGVTECDIDVVEMNLDFVRDMVPPHPTHNVSVYGMRAEQYMKDAEVDVILYDLFTWENGPSAYLDPDLLDMCSKHSKVMVMNLITPPDKLTIFSFCKEINGKLSIPQIDWNNNQNDILTLEF